MKKNLKWIGLVSCAVAAAALVAACGGGGNKTNISSVKVFGDSLADSGVFGYKFTVQAAAGSPATPIYPDLVAARFGISNALCPYHMVVSAAGAVAVNPAASACSNFAVGGGRVITPVGYSEAYSIPKQLAAASAKYGAYTGSDLILIDGGGNDAADLISSYLNASTPAGIASYQNFLQQALPTATVGNYFASGASGFAQAGNEYMKALADKHYDSIKTNVLDKGAFYVAVLNAPAVTNTPRFQLVLGSIAASGGVAQRNSVETLAKSWVSSFNTQLATRVSGDKRVALVDFYSEFNNQIANPSAYGFTNTTTPACPITGVDAQGLPSYTFTSCTATALSAAPPVGVTDTNWWKTYAFSDGFHPTPLGHQLLGNSIAEALVKAGWL